MNITVLGCGGYIGSYLCEYLLRNTKHNVLGIDSFIYDNLRVAINLTETFDRFLFYVDDIRNLCRQNLNRLKKSDILLIFSGLVGQPLCDKHPDLAEEINNVYIGKIIKDLSKNQIIISPNTNSSYGNSDALITEESPFNPLSVYARTKIEGEKHVLSHPMGHSLRLGTAFGVSPRMRTDLLVPSFVYKLMRHAPLKIYEPHFIRNFVGLKDIVRAVDFFIDNPKPGVYNLNDPEANISKLDLAELICKTLDSYLGCQFAKVIPVKGKDQDQRNARVSSQKIMDLGFRFRHSLAKGIIETYDFYYGFYPKTNEEIESMSNLCAKLT